jgi:phosphoribosylglycinamide formyltransferase 1
MCRKIVVAGQFIGHRNAETRNFASVKRIAVFASGSGSNARTLMQYFEFHADAQVTLLVCNNPDAGVLEIARENGVETMLVDREQFYDYRSVSEDLKVRGIDLIVLAGFLWLVPPVLVKDFAGRIVNIHPALLPKFGGKGMYGKHVHKAVLEAGETESGITIHFVNENFDEGGHIAQYSCKVEPGDTVETLAARVQELEHKYYAGGVEKVLEGL